MNSYNLGHPLMLFSNGICQEKADKMKMTEKAGRETPGADEWFYCELVNVIGGRVTLHIQLGFSPCFDWPPQCIWVWWNEYLTDWIEEPHYLMQNYLTGMAQGKNCRTNMCRKLSRVRCCHYHNAWSFTAMHFLPKFYYIVGVYVLWFLS